MFNFLKFIFYSDFLYLYIYIYSVYFIDYIYIYIYIILYNRIILFVANLLSTLLKKGLSESFTCNIFINELHNKNNSLYIITNPPFLGYINVNKFTELLSKVNITFIFAN